MKLLILQHVPHEHPGYIADYAQEKGIELDVIKLWESYTLPSVDTYGGLIVMGGPMGVYENYPSEQDELALIKTAIGKIPMLGLCLGSQLIAHALGAEVHPNMKDGKIVKEIGYYSIDLTDAAKTDPLFRDFSSPVNVLEWHGDAFELPSEATLLATSPQCTNQAFMYKNAYGLLFHFEFKPEMVERQIAIDKEWIHKDHEIDEAELAPKAQEYASAMKQQCYKLMDNFMSLMKG